MPGCTDHGGFPPHWLCCSAIVHKHCSKYIQTFTSHITRLSKRHVTTWSPSIFYSPNLATPTHHHTTNIGLSTWSKTVEMDVEKHHSTTERAHKLWNGDLSPRTTRTWQIFEAHCACIRVGSSSPKFSEMGSQLTQPIVSSFQRASERIQGDPESVVGCYS